MTVNKSHEFHFIISSGLKNNLINLKLFREIGSLSGVIRKILALFTPVMKSEHTWGEQRESRYVPVSSDPDEKREHVHLYISEEVYRELKLIHQDLNVYSIAQLLRWILWFFLDLVREYGEQIIDRLKELFTEWNIQGEKNSLTTREVVRQLSRIIRHLPGQTGIVTLYSNDYSPFWIFRL